MTPEARRKYFNLCDPETSLAPSDDRWVDLDMFGTDEGGPVRGERWVEDLAQEITNSDRPRCLLLTGLPGSGKSTLLRQLVNVLQNRTDGGRPFLCATVNAERWLDPASPIDVPDILLPAVYEVERAVRAAEGVDPDEAAQDGVFQRLWDWFSRTDVTIKGADGSLGGEVGLPGLAKVSAGAKALLELKTNPTLRGKMRDAVRERMYAFLAQVQGHIATLHERAVKLRYEGIVVVFDSLEKLRGIHSNFEEVIESAERIFAQGATYLRLADPELGEKAPRVHVLYTVPPALVMRRAIHDLRFIPMIKLRDRETGDRYEPGYKAARELIRKRVPDALLVDVFGPTNLVARCDEIIRLSGGYPRDIVRMLRECVKQSERIDEGLFQRLLSNAGAAYRRTVTVDLLPWLAEVARHRDLRLTDSDDHRRQVDRALADNLVLRYKNQIEWFDLHPAIRDMPALVEEMNKTRLDPKSAT